MAILLHQGNLMRKIQSMSSPRQQIWRRLNKKQKTGGTKKHKVLREMSIQSQSLRLGNYLPAWGEGHPRMIDISRADQAIPQSEIVPRKYMKPVQLKIEICPQVESRRKWSSLLPSKDWTPTKTLSRNTESRSWISMLFYDIQVRLSRNHLETIIKEKDQIQAPVTTQKARFNSKETSTPILSLQNRKMSSKIWCPPNRMGIICPDLCQHPRQRECSPPKIHWSTEQDHSNQWVCITRTRPFHRHQNLTSKPIRRSIIQATWINHRSFKHSFNRSNSSVIRAVTRSQGPWARTNATHRDQSKRISSLWLI